MFLEIILTILVLVLISMSIGIYIWWTKYGKKMFDLMENMKTINKGVNIDPSMLGNMDNIFSKQDELFNSLNNMFSKIKK